ncbi:cytochrome p450 protein [Diplodia corticola]|uniref:Cytochrome p450 protein n=1 Tax=Diplodia corticola TaxID=236234 RepID=A0A1J9QSI8_9PEZI|nr:cytochrome p450 protein [Diplodia corticola]OJD30954.1 cytochrome p450 protein [Diplodia corticola]
MSTINFATGSADDDIYIGVWTNWARGRVFGATLTVTSRDGALLVAFLALFVSLAGSGLWKIACFALHHVYSTDAPKDALHHQRQAILRNSANGTSGLIGFVQLLWAWRHSSRVDRPYRRTFPLLALTLALVGAFATAGTFSSKIATAMGHEVLVSSGGCQITDSTGHEEQDLELLWYPYIAGQVVSSSNYALECYSDKVKDRNCQHYIKPRLESRIVRNATCPFGEEVCRLQNGNLILDTGYMDSHSDLGINTPFGDRLLVRRVVSCAPLAVEGYKDLKQYDELGPTNYTRYFYGPQSLGLQHSNNFTFQYPEFSKEEYFNSFYDVGDTSYRGAYSIDTWKYRIINGTTDNIFSDWDPIPALRYLDADVMVFFLSANWMLFNAEVNDPWYSAHRKIGDANNGVGQNQDDSIPVIVADEAASPLACKVQQQLCNPSSSSGGGDGNPRCSRMMGLYEPVGTSIGDLGLNGRQKGALLKHISALLKQGCDHLFEAVGVLGPAALMSKFAADARFQGPLPDDQWQLDVEYWHNTSLAFLQAYAVEAAKGPSDPRIDKFVVPTDDDDDDDDDAAWNALCRSQKVRSDAHFNFSVFWLSVTLGLSAVAVALSCAVEPLARRVQRSSCRRDGADPYARLEWAANGTLQLQRLAHEGLGAGGVWTRCVDDVPVTADGRERLAALDLSDPEHPRLMEPVKGLDEVLAGGGADRGTGFGGVGI